jgi:Rps23 Pro-64 3,4-dihydroxylase Tpa1-like proline 4-hydroxylase
MGVAWRRETVVSGAHAPEPPVLRLDPTLEPEAFRPVFKQFNRLHIPGILVPEDAAGVQRAILASASWRRLIRAADGLDYDIPVEEIEELPAGERATFEDAVRAEATDAFRYMFDGVRMSDEVLKGRPIDPRLFSVLQFLNSDAFLGFVRRLTGDDRAVFADAIATRYLPGHFLTAHDDEAPGENRLFAYVLNLTGRWRADWGGMLLFLDEQDHVAEGYVPAFNALNIFRVPQRHAVSFVTPYAGGPRLSVTGWIRSRVPEGWTGRNGV